MNTSPPTPLHVMERGEERTWKAVLEFNMEAFIKNARLRHELEQLLRYYSADEITEALAIIQSEQDVTTEQHARREKDSQFLHTLKRDYGLPAATYNLMYRRTSIRTFREVKAFLSLGWPGCLQDIEIRGFGVGRCIQLQGAFRRYLEDHPEAEKQDVS